MKKTLEQRVADLEKQVAELRQQRGRRPAKIKDWTTVVGIMEDTPSARKADALGAAYRRAQKWP